MKKEAPKAIKGDYRVKANPKPEPIKADYREEPRFHEPTLRAISFNQVKNYIGSRVVLTERTGHERTATLAGVSGDFIELENRSDMGTISISFKRSEIKSLKVYR